MIPSSPSFFVMLVLLAASVLLTAVVAAVDSPFSDAPLAHSVSYPVVHKLEQLLLSDDKECPPPTRSNFALKFTAGGGTASPS